VKGQGMINMRTHDAGDLIIQFDVEFPSEKSPLGPQAFKVNFFLICFSLGFCIYFLAT
jgi:DnaJ-class molecular chaperone